MLVLISAGCVGGGGGTTPPPPPPCTITVYSQCGICWGYIWVNGLSTGQYISQNGQAVITGLTAGTTATVQIVDQFNQYSHQEILVLVAGNNVVTFTYW